VANLRGDAASGIVFHGMAVVSNRLGAEGVAAVKIDPLIAAPRGKIEAGLGADRSAFAVGLR